MNEKTKTKKTGPSTFRQVFGAPAGQVSEGLPVPYWRITGSGVSSEPEKAFLTKLVVQEVEKIGVNVERTVFWGMCNADMYRIRADFLDGGLAGETGNYIGWERGVIIKGPKAVLLIALGLRLKIPAEFFEMYGLSNDITFADLVREVANE